MITISNNIITAKSPEGDKRSMKVHDFMEKLSPPQMNTAGVVLPDGVKAVIPAGGYSIMVHQSPPQVYAFKWVDEKSPVRYGSGTAYRTIRIALPYLIIMAQFKDGVLCQTNECFFTTAPIESIDDPLLFPALLNCSKFREEEAGTRPLSWICSQYVNWTKARAGKDKNEKVKNGIKALLNCLLETGFNESSEHNEGQSWYGASKGIDKRITTIKAWEKATEKDPLFVLNVPWLSTGLSVQQMAERIIGSLGGSSNGHVTQEAMARIVFNYGTP